MCCNLQASFTVVKVTCEERPCDLGHCKGTMCRKQPLTQELWSYGLVLNLRGKNPRQRSGIQALQFCNWAPAALRKGLLQWTLCSFLFISPRQHFSNQTITSHLAKDYNNITHRMLLRSRISADGCCHFSPVLTLQSKGFCSGFFLSLASSRMNGSVLSSNLWLIPTCHHKGCTVAILTVPVPRKCHVLKT